MTLGSKALLAITVCLSMTGCFRKPGNSGMPISPKANEVVPYYDGKGSYLTSYVDCTNPGDRYALTYESQFNAKTTVNFQCPKSEKLSLSQKLSSIFTSAETSENKNLKEVRLGLNDGTREQNIELKIAKLSGTNSSAPATAKFHFYPFLGPHIIAGATGSKDSTIDDWLVFENSEPVLNLSHADGAVAYKIDIKDASGQETVCESQYVKGGEKIKITGCSLNPDGNYTINSTAYNYNLVSEATNKGFLLKVDALEPVPAPIQGVTGLTDGDLDPVCEGCSDPEVNWESMQNAYKYTLKVRDTLVTQDSPDNLTGVVCSREDIDPNQPESPTPRPTPSGGLASTPYDNGLCAPQDHKIPVSNWGKSKLTIQLKDSIGDDPSFYVYNLKAQGQYCTSSDQETGDITVKTTFGNLDSTSQVTIANIISKTSTDNTCVPFSYEIPQIYKPFTTVTFEASSKMTIRPGGEGYVSIKTIPYTIDNILSDGSIDRGCFSQVVMRQLNQGSGESSGTTRKGVAQCRNLVDGKSYFLYLYGFSRSGEMWKPSSNNGFKFTIRKPPMLPPILTSTCPMTTDSQVPLITWKRAPGSGNQDFEVSLTPKNSTTPVLTELTDGLSYQPEINKKVSEGFYTYSIRSKDIAQNFSDPVTCEIEIIKDVIPPNLSILSPTKDSEIRVFLDIASANSSTPFGTMVSTGTCEPGLPITVQGAIYTNAKCDTEGKFSIKLKFVGDSGVRSFTLSQRDLAGNIKSDSRKVLYYSGSEKTPESHPTNTNSQVLSILTPALDSTSSAPTVSGICQSPFDVIMSYSDGSRSWGLVADDFKAPCIDGKFKMPDYSFGPDAGPGYYEITVRQTAAPNRILYAYTSFTIDPKHFLYITREDLKWLSPGANQTISGEFFTFAWNFGSNLYGSRFRYTVTFLKNYKPETCSGTTVETTPYLERQTGLAFEHRTFENLVSGKTYGIKIQFDPSQVHEASQVSRFCSSAITYRPGGNQKFRLAASGDFPLDIGTYQGNKGLTCAIQGKSDLRCWDWFRALTPKVVGTIEPLKIAINGYKQLFVLDQGALKVSTYDSPTNNMSPIQTIASLSSGVADFSLGDNHGCAIQGNAVKCWGINKDGALGLDTSVSSRSIESPNTITFPNQLKPVQIAAGHSHTCVTLNDSSDKFHSVQCWGSGTSGQLGNNTFESSLTPVEALGMTAESGVTEVLSMAAGYNVSCVTVKHSNSSISKLYCWGVSLDDRLSNIAHVPLPYFQNPAPTLSTWSTVPEGDFQQVSGANMRGCGLRNGSVYCLGLSANGQTGYPKVDIQQATAQKIPGLEYVTKIQSLGPIGGCAISSKAGEPEGSLYCWGDGTTSIPKHILW